ncbi:DUF3857 domain-containing protein [Flavobacterium sp.]|uniref:DUF3857 domain-containing protein n=1 Tax=Flavobacterium sp. TaxID=239 RepID=UPI0025BF0B48|nr:DUF3857 domain-containing protein [Flavobacterium sp.]
MKTKLTIVFVLLFALSFAQKKYEIQKVNAADFTKTKCDFEPSAEAEYLYKIGDVKFEYDKNDGGFKIVTKVKGRIKIYQKDAYRFANIEVPYYQSSNKREKISFDNCYTYNLVNGQVEKTKLKSEGIFDTKENKFWGQKKAVMPNVKEGSIIEYEYTIESPFLFNLPDWYFQAEIPVVYSEFKTTIPEYFTFSHNQRGFLPLEIETTTRQSSVHFSDKNRSDEGYVTKTTYDEYDVKFVENVSKYGISNVRSLKEEKYMGNFRNYICSISHELMMTKFPNSTVKTYSTDWDAVARNIHESDDFGGELSKTGYFEEQLKPLLASAQKPEEKVLLICEFVKANMKWNGRKTYWCDEGVKSAFKQKTGNAAEINLMLTSMLRFAGLDANPVLVSTRSHGISLFPATAAFDFVVSSVKIGENLVLLDATDPYSSPGILPARDLNWRGLLVDKNGKSRDVSMLPNDAANSNMTLVYKVNPMGNIEGKMRRQLSAHKALEHRVKSVGKKDEAYLEELENDFRKFELSDYKRENEKECHKDFIESCAFKKDGAVEIIGDRLYFSPLLFFAEAENPFKMETRDYPVDFVYPTRGKYLVMVDLPEGYAVESLPTGTSLATEESLGTFKYSIAANGPKLQIMVNYEINQALVPTQSYPMLRDFYQKMVDKQNEKVVLKKI